MDKRIQHRLNQTQSQSEVNVNAQTNLQLESNQSLLPVGELNRVLNVGDRFNKERQDSTRYRINGTITTIFSNILSESTGINLAFSKSVIGFTDFSISFSTNSRSTTSA